MGSAVRSHVGSSDEKQDPHPGLLTFLSLHLNNVGVFTLILLALFPSARWPVLYLLV